MPVISVIVPIYKVEPYLRKCIDSVLAQTFTDFELILVDDGSPDNCGAICDEYAAKDNRIRVIHQENRGLSAARNAGIDWAFANSDSQWLTFIDSDDMVSPDFLAKMISATEQAHADLCVCDFLSVFPAGKEEKDTLVIPERVSTGSALLEEGVIYSNWHFVISCNKLYRKQIFDDIRFPVGYIHEDEAIIHRVLGAARNVICIKDQLYYYYRRTGSITGTGKSIKSTDYLFSLADRIQYAKQHRLPNLFAESLNLYQSFLKYTALPLLLDANEGDMHISRSARSTRAVLPNLLCSSRMTLREKARITLFSLLPSLYLHISRKHAKKVRS